MGLRLRSENLNFVAEKEILETALAALMRETGLQCENQGHFDKRGIENGYKIAFRASQEKRPREFRAEIRKTLNHANIAQAALEAERAREKRVLVAEYVSQPQAEKLRSLGIAFFDAAGNAYFNEPGLYVFVSGRKAKTGKPITPRLFRPPGMKLLFAFLTEPKLENESYRRISLETNVPTPTVGVFMGDLEKAGYLARGRGNERRIFRRDELLRRWVENYGESFRATLKPVRFRSEKYDGRWWEDVEIEKYGDALWGGETGGARLTGHLKPETATIYSDSLLPKLQAQYGLMRDNRGDVEILKNFWTRPSKIAGVAPPLVVYADLMATADRRNLETAQMIYERYLADFAETAS